MKTELPEGIEPDEIWRDVKRDLKNRFIGKLALTYRLNLKVLPSSLLNRAEPSSVSSVIVDSGSSEFFTTIKLFTLDRIGLLYRITHTLADLRLLIRVAKISTKGKYVSDLFYVQDLMGMKIKEKERLREIKRALLQQVNQR